MTDNFGDYCGLEVLSAENGMAKLQFKVMSHHLNNHNSIHGGMLFTLIDSTGGCALRSISTVPFVTLSDSTFYLSNVQEGIVAAEGKVVRKGRNTALVEVVVTDKSGKQLCRSLLEYYFLNRK